MLPQSVAQFDGQSSYIALAGGPSIISFPSGVMTISAWIYPATSVHPQDIITEGYQTSYTGYEFRVSSSGTLNFRYNPPSTWVYAASTNSTKTSSWNYVAATYDGTYVNFYINGVLAEATPVAANGNILVATGSSPIIGAYASMATYFLGGSIANVQVYNATLDASQIRALYTKGIGAAPIDPNHIVGWWPLNGDANDYSGNNNNGAPTNVVYTSSWTSGYTPP